MKFKDAKDAIRFVQNFHKVLGGFSPGEHKHIHDLFWATVMREMFVQMHKSFVDRSVTGSDRFGETWTFIKLSTIKKKSRPHKRGKLMLPASQTPGLTNRDTGRLLNSFEPGTISGSTYIPVNMDQRAFWRGRQMILESRVPYAKKVDLVRKLFKNQSKEMLERAIYKALNAIVPLVNRP